MTAFDMILEGTGAWFIGLTSGHPVLLFALFASGSILAGIGHYLWNTTPAKDVTQPIPEADNSLQLNAFLDSIPFPASVSDATGSITSNDAFRLLQDTLVNAAPNERHLVNVDGQDSWFTVSESTVDGTSLRFALPADDLVHAEQSLKRLMETLSTTFAHLPVGLAVFDADKTLNLFNPALCELLGLDPTWLAMRPTIASFLENLRDSRHLPEKKNFLEWRRLLTKMEAAAANKDYSGEWNLSNGQVLRVQGQAHSQGAVAFLFEDITAEIQVSRLRHSETALNQAVLDQISDAIVVLDAAGSTGFTNARFDAVYPVDTTSPLQGFSILDLGQSLPETPEVGAFLKRLRGFVSQDGNRTAWTQVLPAPANTLAKIFPLPEGSTFVSFSPIENAAGNDVLSTLFQFTDTMITTFNESNSMSDPLNLNGLTDFLKNRGISLNLDGFSTEAAMRSAPVKTRRILWYLVLAASNVCRDEGHISLTTNESGRSVRISCLIEESDILTVQNNHLSLGLLRQLVDQAGGGADWVFDNTARPLTVSCVLPVAPEENITGYLASNA